MKDLMNFTYSGKQVRVVNIDGEPWWLAKDVTDILGLPNGREAVRQLENDEKTTVRITDGGPERNIVNEPGLYSLIFRSRKNEAKVFKWWVTHEVLPSIRKTGGYGLPSTFAEALQLAADQAKELEKARPAVDFFKAVTDSKDAIPMDQVAKVLDMGVGRNRLFRILREKEILMESNIPYQRYVDEGWFRVVEQKYTRSNSETHINIKPLVYQKGVNGIRRLLEKTNNPKNGNKLSLVMASS